jgi:hypothetical protein
MLFEQLNMGSKMATAQFGGSIMATDAQIAANRRNAARSTGPRTPEGKATVSQNAVKHGLRAGQAVIRGEDPGEYEFYRDRILAELAPVGMIESVLAERAAGLAWRLRRAERVQNEVFDALYSGQADDPLAKLTQSLLPKRKPQPQAAEDGRDLTLGRVVIRDFANSRVLDRLLMYERRIENSLFRTMRELQRLRLVRELEPASDSGRRDALGVGRLPRRCAARNDEPKCGARGGRGANASRDGGGYGSAAAWREYEARHEAEKRAECDRLLEYSAAQRNQAAVGGTSAKQSQSGSAVWEKHFSVQPDQAAAAEGHEAVRQTKPILGDDTADRAADGTERAGLRVDNSAGLGYDPALRATRERSMRHVATDRG